MTQCERVLDYMQRFGSINPVQAYADLGIMRLGARIYDLKREGYEVVSMRARGKNRFGEQVSFEKYMLASEKFLQENENHIPGA